jgi:primosomal protein N' (replication factor Y)
VLGPSPAVLARVRGAYRWHVLLKAPRSARISRVVADALRRVGTRAGVTAAPDIDPLDLL